MDDTAQQAAYAATLEAAKRASTGQLLFKAARLWNEAAVARVGAMGASGLRVSHTGVFPHIDLEGTRASVIAERMGISKQAVGRLIDDLEQMGVVARQPDPRDGRAQLVVWTEQGRQGLLHGLGVLREMEAELVARVGEARMLALRETLAELVVCLTPAEPGLASPAQQG